MGEEYDEAIRAYVDTLRNSTPVEGKKIILPGDDRITLRKRNN